MKHPDPEAWMSYLYDETPATERAALEEHLGGCPECRTRVAEWRGTMTRLDEDQATLVIPARGTSTGFRWRPAARRAAAAAAMLCAGFLAGRAGMATREDLRREVAVARKHITAELQARREQELKAVVEAAVTATTGHNRLALSQMREDFAAARATDQRQLLTLLDRMEVRHTADYRRLSGGLVQLARTTGDGFQQTEDQFNTLGAYIPATDSPATLKEIKQ